MFKQFRWLLMPMCLVVVAVIFGGCSVLSGDCDEPPYGITTPVYKLAGPDDLCTYGGVFFDFYNKSEKEVVFIQTCMNIYNTKSGSLAFSGAGGMTCGASCRLSKSQKKNLCISLDGYPLPFDSAEVCVDNFYISRIDYADGTTWADRFGVYAVSFKEGV